jgi:hypothetical protein
MRSKDANSLPKTLPGVVCRQWVKCGRPVCRCARGNLHGPYFYRFWRENGRLRKVYVPRAELEKVRCSCEARQRERRKLSAGWHTWRKVLEFIRAWEEQRERRNSSTC